MSRRTVLIVLLVATPFMVASAIFDLGDAVRNAYRYLLGPKPRLRKVEREWLARLRGKSPILRAHLPPNKRWHRLVDLGLIESDGERVYLSGYARHNPACQ